VPDQLLERLRSVELFKDLTESELQRIARAGKEVEFERGRTITAEGESGVGFHLILDGAADVVVHGRTVKSIGPGEYFGEMSLLDGKPRSATVTVTAPMRTFALASWDFLPVLESTPSIARKLLVELSRRIRELQDSALQ
jgi:CRP-like cAMP-binding protein